MKEVRKILKICPLLCYSQIMRQKFDIGDLVETTHPHSGQKGIILETEPINRNIDYPTSLKWHTDEYKCKVQFLTSSEVRWVRAKWLAHLSKISE